MIVMVDGWVYQYPPETAYLEFRSSHERGHAGGVDGFTSDGERVERQRLELPDVDPWYVRIGEPGADPRA